MPAGRRALVPTARSPARWLVADLASLVDESARRRRGLRRSRSAELRRNPDAQTGARRGTGSALAAGVSFPDILIREGTYPGGPRPRSRPASGSSTRRSFGPASHPARSPSLLTPTPRSMREPLAPEAVLGPDRSFDHGAISRFNAWFFTAFAGVLEHSTRPHKTAAFAGLEPGGDPGDRRRHRSQPPPPPAGLPSVRGRAAAGCTTGSGGDLQPRALHGAGSRRRAGRDPPRAPGRWTLPLRRPRRRTSWPPRAGAALDPPPVGLGLRRMRPAPRDEGSGGVRGVHRCPDRSPEAAPLPVLAGQHGCLGGRHALTVPVVGRPDPGRPTSRRCRPRGRRWPS